MRRCRAAFGILVLGGVTLGSPVTASGQPRAGTFDEALSRLHRGQVVWVKDSAGTETRSQVDDLSGGRLTVTRRGERQEFAARDVVRLRVEERDPLWNGAVIGVLVALPYPLWYCSQSYESGETCGENIGNLAMGAAIGAAIGAGIDALKKRRRTVYQAPRAVSSVRIAPAFSRRAAGMSVSLRF